MSICRECGEDVINAPGTDICKECQDNINKLISPDGKCPCCDGTGTIKESGFIDGDEETCMTCNGSGKY